MKTLQQLAGRLSLGAFLFAASATHAQFPYITNNGTITVTSYNGSGGMVTYRHQHSKLARHLVVQRSTMDQLSRPLLSLARAVAATRK